MEPKFQSSFIPKKTLGQSKAKKRVRSNNFVSMVALIIFLAAVLMAVGVFLYTEYLKISINSKEEQLTRARGAFEPALIKELTRLDDRIEGSKELLDKHVAPSRLFTYLENNTLENVRFSDFLLSAIDENTYSLTMTGEAKSFSAVALQSDRFGESDIIVDHVFANLDLDSFGNVRFNFSAYVPASEMLYEKVITTSLNTE